MRIYSLSSTALREPSQAHAFRERICQMATEATERGDAATLDELAQAAKAWAIVQLAGLEPRPPLPLELEARAV